ncbi:TPA: cation:proton antiporter regulatory subunit [Staphylococcus pseudintermedius]
MEGQIIPGIGTKYSLTTANNEMVHVILHYNGKREIYITDDDEDVIANIGLNESEAREIALKLMDVNHDTMEKQAFERFTLLRKQMLVDWIKVGHLSPLKGINIEQAEHRVPNGVNIVGISRGSDIIPKPDSSELIHEGDILLVIGYNDAVSEFEAACRPQG